MSEEVNISWKSAFRIAIAIATISALASLIYLLVLTTTIRTAVSSSDDDATRQVLEMAECMSSYENHPMKEQANEVCYEKVYGWE